MKALHFGAGNIGRGFIGLILSDNHYHVTFADVNSEIVNQLKQERHYDVTLANDEQTKITVNEVDALHSEDDQKQLEKAILEADVITTAVGVQILPIIAKSLARPLKQRTKPVNIVACENAINATDQLREALEAEVGVFDDSIHFSNAAVDRIVPIQQHDNLLDVTVEPFFEWVIETSTWYGKRFEGVKYVNSLTPYIERKLLTVNTGHAYLAYAGQYYGLETILEAVSHLEIKSGLNSTLEETSQYLASCYDFDTKDLAAYRKTIIERFKNPHLSDDITRVGRGVLRKLGPNDRIMKPLNYLYKKGMSYHALSTLAAYALKYQDTNDKESVEKDESLQNQSVASFLESHAQVDSHLAQDIEKIYQSL